MQATEEPLVVDGFETFAHSQFFPLHINLAVGAKSWFLYHFTDAPLRRKGRMTPGQQQKRADLESRFGRPDPKAVERSMAALLRPLLSRPGQGAFHIFSDDHPAYRRALALLRREHPHNPPIVQHITSSTERRTRSNPLFPVNLTDLLLRHANANHRRETIAFSKVLPGIIDRMAVFTVWRNYVKKRRENDADPAATAAMRAGILTHPLDWPTILQKRIFPAHVHLPREWADYYARRVALRIHKDHPPIHALRFAF